MKKVILSESKSFFGTQLRQLRESQNVTQEELAEAMGVKQSAVSKIESGGAMPSAESFINACLLLDANPYDFFHISDRRERTYSSKYVQACDVPDPCRQICELCKTLDPEKQTAILSFIRTMTDFDARSSPANPDKPKTTIQGRHRVDALRAGKD